MNSNEVEMLDTSDAPEDDNYKGLPNEDGINEEGQNVFLEGPY